MQRRKLAAIAAFVLGLAVACGGGAAIVSGPDSTPAPAPAGQPVVIAGLEFSQDGIAEPDPLFQVDLLNASIFTEGWLTDFSRHTVPLDSIRTNLVRDAIRSLDAPTFVGFEQADFWLGDAEPVIALEIDGQARAYPLQILIFHEIANDTLAGVPVAVTFCPLCNSAIVMDRRVDGNVLEFGVSGNLRNSDLIMWDRQTESWWQQFTGDAIVGALAGKQLEFVAAPIVSYADFKAGFSGAQVLSRDTGFDRPYGLNPYPGYDRADTGPFAFQESPDVRLLPKERVVAVSNDDDTAHAAFSFTVLARERVVNYNVGSQPVAIFFKPGTISVLDSDIIDFSKEIGSTGVFTPEVDGRALTFSLSGDAFVDDQTGTTWSILGKGLSGELAGKQLTPVVHGDHFWFAWAAFQPKTKVYQGATAAR